MTLVLKLHDLFWIVYDSYEDGKSKNQIEKQQQQQQKQKKKEKKERKEKKILEQ